jgi:Ser/Thr protein kinase RdoA (MazF antagonist)
VAIPESSLVVDPADIAAHWEIELPTPLEPLATIRNLVFRSGAYVIRDVEAPVENVAWEHDLLTFLAPQLSEIVPPLRAADDTTFLSADGHVVWLQRFVDAPPAKRSDRHVREQVPTLLARIHRACREWPRARPRPDRPSLREQDWVVNETWDWNVLERTPLIEHAYDVTAEWVANPPPLTESAMHGDFHPENLLASDERIEAVLDWEFSRLDWPAFDLAAAVTVVSLQRDGTLDRTIAAETVASYVDAGGHDESYALDPLIRIFLLEVALHGRTRKAHGESWQPEFQEMIETALAAYV